MEHTLPDSPVKTWKGGTYGIRIPLRYRDEHLKGLEEIVIELGNESKQFKLQNTFWTTCPEVRGKCFKIFFEKNGLILPWEKGKPYKLNLRHIRKNIFSLKAT